MTASKLMIRAAISYKSLKKIIMCQTAQKSCADGDSVHLNITYLYVIYDNLPKAPA